MCNPIWAPTTIMEIKSDQAFVALHFVLFRTNNQVYINAGFNNYLLLLA